MADIRCPQCNALNASDAEKCWSCEAPLLSDESSQDSLGWLKDLRAGAVPQEQEDEIEDILGDEDETPDWLKRIRQRSQSEQEFGESDDLGDPAGEDLPDWLKDLQNQPLDEVIGDRAEDAAIPPPSGAAESAGWFMESAEFSPEKDQDTGGEDLPEWLLEDLGEKPSLQPSASDQILSDAGKEAAPDFFAQEESAAPAEDLPDWLAGLSVEPEPAGEQPTGEGTAAFSADLPDWLAEQPQATEAEGEMPSGEGTVAFSADLPDWLAGLSVEQEPAGEQPSGEGTAAFSADLPDWLAEQPEEAKLEGEAPAGEETAVFSARLSDSFSDSQEPLQAGATPPEDEELPSWLFADLREDAQQESEVELAPAADMPAIPPVTNWFDILGSEESGAGLPEPENAVPEEQAQEPVGAFEQEPVEAEAVEAPEPATVAEPQPGAPEETEVILSGEEEDLSVTAFEMEELPDWLSEEQVDFPQAEPGASMPAFILDGEEQLEDAVIDQVHPFSDEDIPAWLTAEEQPESEEVETEDLARTALPNWVEAMRPVDTVAYGGAVALISEQHIEKAGPLAGLTGILPADSAAVEYGRPPAYAMRMRISDKQRASAALLETILEEEGSPKEFQREKPGVPQAILRLLVGILLITVIVLSGGLSEVSSQAPAGNSINAINFSRQLDSLPIGGTVLIAVEFDPAYSAEMTLAGQGVIERLLARDNRLVMVSTTLAGPVLAEEMIRTASSGEFAQSDRVTNLGYLAGGIISMKEFSLAPQIAARYGMDWVRTGQPVWQQPALQAIQQVADFNLVLVMTDSGDTGRMWIEQIGPHLSSVPLLMVTTAQAAPILTPYLTGGQLDGLISGISGGRSFSPLDFLAQMERTWAAFRAGILVTVALILIGVLFRGVSSMIPGPKS